MSLALSTVVPRTQGRLVELRAMDIRGDSVHTLYKKLLRLYPREFRERLGESMEQTFNDLYRERRAERGLFGFMFWMFAETGAGIIKEHGVSMKTLLSNPRSATLTSLLLSLPLGLTFVAFMFDIEPLVKPLNELFTVECQRGEINMLGRIVIFGGLLLLPVAFVLNLHPMLRNEGTEGKEGSTPSTSLSLSPFYC